MVQVDGEALKVPFYVQNHNHRRCLYNSLEDFELTILLCHFIMAFMYELLSIPL